MGIWIRSQDKESLGCTNKIGYTDFGRFQRKGHFIVDADETNHAYLGEYPTKERAIEVLNEIQAKIRDIKLAEIGAKNAYETNYTYLMPTE